MTGIISKNDLKYKKNESKSLELHKLYVAEVLDVIRPENKIKVKVLKTSSVLICDYAGSVISYMMGVSVKFLPTRGTKAYVIPTSVDGGIVVSYGEFASEGYAFKDDTIISNDASDKNDEAKKRNGPQDKKENLFTGSFSTGPHADIIEGELDITNNLDCGIQILRHIARLSAGDLARVECMLVDDMVRIVSDTFKHMSSFGDYNIYNDEGRVNVVWEGSSMSSETTGLTDPNTGEIDATETAHDKAEPLEEDVIRKRFSLFIGFIGDFISLFITDPFTVLSNTVTGKFRMNIKDSDGSFIMQSTGDIVFEKVVRVMVPIKKKEVFNKTHDTAEPSIPDWDLSTINEEDWGLYTFYNIRDYIKWFSNYHTLEKFRREAEQYELKEEAEYGKLNDLVEAYSTIRIFKTGEILIMDAFNNTVEMNRAGLTLFSEGDVRVVSKKDISMMSHGDFNVYAHNNINLRSRLNTQSISGRNMTSISEGGTVSIVSHRDGNTDDTGGVHIRSNSNITNSARSQILNKSSDNKIETTNVFSVNNELTHKKDKFVVSSKLTQLSNVEAYSLTGILTNTIYKFKLAGGDQHDGHVKVGSPSFGETGPTADKIESANILNGFVDYDKTKENGNDNEINWLQPVGDTNNDPNIPINTSVFGETGKSWPGSNTKTYTYPTKVSFRDLTIPHENAESDSRFKVKDFIQKPGLHI